jgi:hypothetical protein
MSRKKLTNIILLDPNNEEDADVLNRIKTHPRIEFEAYQELVKTGMLDTFCNLKAKRKIFFDETTEMFCYYNPYHRKLLKCGRWKEEE